MQRCRTRRRTQRGSRVDESDALRDGYLSNFFANLLAVRINGDGRENRAVNQGLALEPPGYHVPEASVISVPGRVHLR